MDYNTKESFDKALAILLKEQQDGRALHEDLKKLKPHLPNKEYELAEQIFSNISDLDKTLSKDIERDYLNLNSEYSSFKLSLELAGVNSEIKFSPSKFQASSESLPLSAVQMEKLAHLVKNFKEHVSKTKEKLDGTQDQMVPVLVNRYSPINLDDKLAQGFGNASRKANELMLQCINSRIQAENIVKEGKQKAATKETTQQKASRAAQNPNATTSHTEKGREQKQKAAIGEALGEFNMILENLLQEQQSGEKMLKELEELEPYIEKEEYNGAHDIVTNVANQDRMLDQSTLLIGYMNLQDKYNDFKSKLEEIPSGTKDFSYPEFQPSSQNLSQSGLRMEKIQHLTQMFKAHVNQAKTELGTSENKQLNELATKYSEYQLEGDLLESIGIASRNAGDSIAQCNALDLAALVIKDAKASHAEKEREKEQQTAIGEALGEFNMILENLLRDQWSSHAMRKDLKELKPYISENQYQEAKNSLISASTRDTQLDEKIGQDYKNVEKNYKVFKSELAEITGSTKAFSYPKFQPSSTSLSRSALRMEQMQHLTRMFKAHVKQAKRDLGNRNDLGSNLLFAKNEIATLDTCLLDSIKNASKQAGKLYGDNIGLNRAKTIINNAKAKKETTRQKASRAAQNPNATTSAGTRGLSGLDLKAFARPVRAGETAKVQGGKVTTFLPKSNQKQGQKTSPRTSRRL